MNDVVTGSGLVCVLTRVSRTMLSKATFHVGMRWAREGGERESMLVLLVTA